MLNRKQKITFCRIIAVLIIFSVLLVLQHTGVITRYAILYYLPPYLLIGYDIIIKAARNITKGSVFDENFLMVIATAGAFVIGEYSEAVAVMLFYQIGELFQGYAVGRSRASIAQMMEIAPEYANVLKDGAITRMDPDDVAIGDTIVVLAGEKIPLDGTVIEGSSHLDTAPLTGESVPRSASAGDKVISGCLNLEGALTIVVEKEYEDSTVARILDLVENAGDKKARTENFITRFAKVYTPVVTAGALLLAFVAPLIFGGGLYGWIRRACVFLIVSCPCALVISVPLGFFGGIGAASRKGIMIKGSSYLEQMTKVTSMVFDKTGTLTKGTFAVSGVYPCAEGGYTEVELLGLAAKLESMSGHPIAVSICTAAGGSSDTDGISDYTEIAGKGITLTLEGKTYGAGNAALLKENGIPVPEEEYYGTTVYIADLDNKTELGAIVISDTVKPEAGSALQALKQNGVKKLILLSGDRKAAAEAVGNELNMDEIYSDLLPGDKVSTLEKLLDEVPQKEYLAYVGDGINDAPVLMRADVGIAMGSLGSDAAIEAADIVLMDDQLTKLTDLFRISRKTMRIVHENIVFSIGVKVLVLILGALGAASMWGAVFADVGVCVIAVLNSMRALKM